MISQHFVYINLSDIALSLSYYYVMQHILEIRGIRGRERVYMWAYGGAIYSCLRGVIMDPTAFLKDPPNSVSLICL